MLTYVTLITMITLITVRINKQKPRKNYNRVVDDLKKLPKFLYNIKNTRHSIISIRALDRIVGIFEEKGKFYTGGYYYAHVKFVF
jgi:hypothetical protein